MVEFRVLGPVEVARDDGRSCTLGGPKQRAVLAHLVLRANEVISTDRLIDQVWGDRAPDAARNALQSYISRLRQALGDATRIEGRTPGYVLRADPGEVDALQFDALVAQARRSLAEDRPEAALGCLDAALALWRGPPLADLADEPSLRAEITRLEERKLTAVEDRVAAELALGHHVQVAAELDALVSLYPLRERLWGLLVLALYRCGRQADALAAYQRARRILAEELGIEPSPDLQRLQGQILRQDPSLEPEAEHLRGYRLLDQVGEGSFGVVYRAVQPHVGREVAIKVVHPALANDPRFIRHFETEAQLIARLEHPRIVPLYDFWREPDAAYLVMRLLRRGSLADALADGPLDLASSARIVEQVAAALDAAHRHQVVHRDVKPANVLLDDDGNAYLSDFGIAVEETASGPPDASFDTIAYRSPEQLRGEPASPRSDIYSLGLVLYELLTGSAPFEAQTPDELMALHLRQPVPPLSSSRAGLPPALDDVIARATAKDPAERYPSVRTFATALLTAVGGAPADLAADQTRNPYKGLRPFHQADAPDFFGRDALIGRLVERLRGGDDRAGDRFVAVVGASGSGKSSLVRAGLLPALADGAVPGSADWFLVEMFPGAHPLEELEAALLRIAVNPPPSLIEQLERDEHGLQRATKRVLPAGDAELLLVIDQFEEMFTLVDDEQRRELFIRSLTAALTDPRGRLRVVIALRADFYDRPLTDEALAALVRAGVETIVPLSPQELEHAIVRPAEQQGIACQPGLVAQIVADVAGRAGALPLLQYALTELFDRREGDALTVSAYREIGGLTGAVARRAEQIYEAATPEGREATRQLFLRLVTLGEPTHSTRRRVTRDELAGLEVDQAALDSVIDAFGRHRLLSFDRDPYNRVPTVEVAHEALLGSWDRLKTWIEAARDDLRMHRRLAAAAQDWDTGGHDGSFLMRGSRLEQFAAWAETSDLALARPEREFLDACVTRRDAERAEEEARTARERALERRAFRRLRAFVALLAVAALGAGALSLYAFGQRQEARDQARVASGRELAAASLANLDDDPERSILLALEAVDAGATGDDVLREAEEALHQAVQSSRVVLAVPGSSALDRGAAVDFDHSGDRLATTTGATATIWDARSGDPLVTLSGHDADVTSLSFSPDGALLATASFDGTARIWDTTTGAELASLPGDGTEIVAVAFSPDGAQVATTNLQTATQLWDPDTGRRLAEIPAGAGYTGLAFSPDGRELVTGGDGGAATVWATDTGQEIRRVDSPTFDVALSPDGTRLAIPWMDGALTIFNAATGEQVTSVTGEGHMFTTEFSPDGRRLAAGSAGGTVTVFDTATGREELALTGQGGAISAVTFSPDGTRVAACCGGGRAMVWDITPGGARELLTLAAHEQETVAAFSPDGRRLATAADQDALVKLWDADDGRALLDLAGHAAPATDVVFSPDGRRLATTSFDGTARIWDTERGREMQIFRGHTGLVWGASLTPDWALLATASEDATGRIWDVETGEQVMSLRDDNFLYDIEFSPDGQRLATAGEAVPKIWDTATGRVVTALEGHDAATLEIVFNPDGTRLATASFDGTARIWDAESGRELLTLKGHAGVVIDITFSPDGNRLATAGGDGTVRLWDARTGRELLNLPIPDGGATSATFRPDGRRLAVGTGAGVVRLYLLDVQELAALARQRVTRTLTDDECRQYLHTDGCQAA